MDWMQISGALLRVVPGALGTVLAGPAGGAIAGTIGDALAKQLGVDPTPEAVTEAIETLPTSKVEEAVRAVEKEHAPAIEYSVRQTEAAMIEQANLTARAELQSESWFVKFARPANIWAVAIVTLGYGVCLVAATGVAVFGRDPSALNILVANAGVLGIALAPSGAVAGVSAWGRTQEKKAGVADLATTVITAVTKGKAK